MITVMGVLATSKYSFSSFQCVDQSEEENSADALLKWAVSRAVFYCTTQPLQYWAGILQ